MKKNAGDQVHFWPMLTQRANVLRFLIYVTLYVVAAEFSVVFVSLPTDVTLIWPSAGLAYAVLLFHGPRWWPVIPCGIALTHLLISPVPWLFFPFSLASNTLATVAAVCLVKRFSGPELITLRVTNGFLMLAGGAFAALLSGLIGVVGMLLASMIAPEDFVPALGKWTAGDIFGIVAVTPLTLMVLRSLERRPLRTLLSVLGIGLSAGIMVMTLFQSIAVEYMVDVQFGFAQRDDLSVSLIEPTDARFAEELAAIPGVQAVEAFRAVPVRLRHGHRSWRGSLLGLAPEPDLKRVLDKDLIAQTLPGDGVLLTDYLADELQLRVGDKLTVEVLQGRRQQLELPVSGTVNEYLGVNAYARRDSLNRWLGDGDVSNGAWLRIDSAQRQSVLDALRARPRVAGVSDREATIQGFRQTMAEGVLTFTLIATLLAASIAAGVVYNAARITLSERGRELASLRVLGYTRRETRALLQGELFSLAIMALLPGIGLGYGLTAMLVAGFQSELYRVPLLGTPSSYGWAGLTVLAATLLSAWLVRRRLDRLDLIAVLKTRE